MTFRQVIECGFTLKLVCDMIITRGGSRTAATSKMQCFVIIVNGLDRFMIIVNGWKPLTFITKRSILDVAAALDPPLITYSLPQIFEF